MNGGPSLGESPITAPAGGVVLNRREVLALAGTATATATVLVAGASGCSTAGAVRPVGPGEVKVSLRVNGVVHELMVEPRVTLLDALRERIGLTGTKKGCDRGECGACTVLVDTERIESCMRLALMSANVEITTVEGLADGDRLHPMQQAFIRHDAFQCGFCTPGQIMSAVGMLGEGRPGSPAEIRERMSGNLCRCSAYPNIVAAISEVATGAAGGGS